MFQEHPGRDWISSCNRNNQNFVFSNESNESNGKIDISQSDGSAQGIISQSDRPTSELHEFSTILDLILLSYSTAETAVEALNEQH